MSKTDKTPADIYENPSTDMIENFKRVPNRTLEDFVDMWSMPTPKIFAEVFQMKEDKIISTNGAYDLLTEIKKRRREHIISWINSSEASVTKLLQ